MAEMNPKTAPHARANPAAAEGTTEAHLHSIREEIAALAEVVRGFAKDQTQTLRQSVSAATDEASAKARKMRDGLAQSAGDAEKALDHQVQAHPFQSLLTAFGLGVLISFLLRR